MEEAREKAKNNFSRKQFSIAVIGMILLILLGSYLANTDIMLTMYLVTGLLFGYILTRARFGFAGGVKEPYMTGNSSLAKALLFTFAITIIATAGVHWGTMVLDGASVTEVAIKGGAHPAPGSNAVKPLNLAVITGGFIFGMGMIMAGGCASGSLTDAGEGAVRSFIALFFFAIGAVFGRGARVMFDQSALADFSTTIYLPEKLGYFGAVLLSFVFLIILYIIVKKYEAMRKKEGSYNEIEYSPDQKSLEESKGFSLFSYETYHKFLVERWSYITGGLLIAMMFIFTMNTTGTDWGVTGAYTYWGVGILQNLGINFANSSIYSGIAETVNNGLLYHAGTLRNVGIIFGSAIAMLLASKFKFDYDFNFYDVSIYALGGLLMGFGARFAKGCNIGALYAAISSFSLHGWFFLIALSLGGIVSLMYFEGKLNIVPNRDN
uniref:YeeE/YedE family protein n=1 Tax=uncultured organism TaxID=155900 RepID=M1PWB8_9ZZZZ|nr:YeeE/YedE family protein [uncultured organism]